MHTKLPIISFYKIHLFVCLIFEEFEGVSKSGILWPVAWAGIIKKFIQFFKIVPLGAPRLFIQKVPKWRGVFNQEGFITNSNHQFFHDPHRSKIWKYFHPYFSFSFALRFILFLEATTKFMMTEGVQNKYIHSMHMLTSSNVYIFQKCI